MPRRKMNTVLPPLGVSDYVLDKTANARYETPVFRITGFSWERAIVEHVGAVKNGRIAFLSRLGPVTHRLTENLERCRYP